MFNEQQVRALRAQGISKTKAAEQLGVTRFQLERYIKTISLDWPKVAGGKHVIDGVTATLKGHADRLGLTVAAVRWRLENDRPMDAPLAIDLVTEAEAQAFYELRTEGFTALKAAEIVGRPLTNLSLAAKRLIPRYSDVCIPRKRRSKKPAERPNAA